MSLENFEADLLKKFAVNKSMFVKISKRLKPDHFRNEAFRWCYETMLEYFNKYGEVPGMSVIESEIGKSSFSTKKKELFIRSISKAFTIKKKISSGYIEDHIEEKIGREEFLTAVDQALKDIDSSSTKEIRNKLVEKLLLEGSDRFDPPEIRVLKDWKLRQAVRENLAKMPKGKRFIMTPFSKINAITHGIQAGEAATVAGATGMGKSILMHEFGFSAMVEGINVAHFTAENTAEQTAQRYDSRITKIKYDTIKLYEFSGEEMDYFNTVFDGISSSLNNDVIIKETVRDMTDIVWIDKEVRTMESRGFQPGLVIIDSCDIMKSLKSYREYRLDRASIYWNFKDWCKMKGIPGLTTTQARKDILEATVKNKKRPGPEDLSEAYDKARILDIIYILYHHTEDEEESVFRLIVAKNRDGPTGTEVVLFKDSERMRFMEIE